MCVCVCGTGGLCCSLNLYSFIYILKPFQQGYSHAGDRGGGWWMQTIQGDQVVTSFMFTCTCFDAVIQQARGPFGRQMMLWSVQHKHSDRIPVFTVSLVQ